METDIIIGIRIMHISSTLIEKKLYLFKSANKTHTHFDLELW